MPLQRHLLPQHIHSASGPVRPSCWLKPAHLTAIRSFALHPPARSRPPTADNYDGRTGAGKRQPLKIRKVRSLDPSEPLVDVLFPPPESAGTPKRSPRTIPGRRPFGRKSPTFPVPNIKTLRIEEERRPEERGPTIRTVSSVNVDVERWESRTPTDPVVLRVRAASANISLNDFIRMSPSGTKFVDGRMDGDLQKVIPLRDQSTFQNTGNYSLVFKTITAARDYQNHLAKLHKLAKDYAPTSLYSPLAPAPGADDPFDTGENQERLLRSYALVPSSHILDNNIVMYPFPDDLLGILARGGYRAVVYGNDPATGTVFHKVLLTFEGMQPSLEMISLAFYRSGRLRGLPWGIANNDVKHFNEVSGKRLEPKAYYKKFVVPFEDEGNAQRFVRAWHRQRLNWWNDEWVTPRGMEDTMINATLLW